MVASSACVSRCHMCTHELIQALVTCRCQDAQCLGLECTEGSPQGLALPKVLQLAAHRLLQLFYRYMHAAMQHNAHIVCVNI